MWTTTAPPDCISVVRFRLTRTIENRTSRPRYVRRPRWKGGRDARTAVSNTVTPSNYERRSRRFCVGEYGSLAQRLGTPVSSFRDASRPGTFPGRNKNRTFFRPTIRFVLRNGRVVYSPSVPFGRYLYPADTDRFRYRNSIVRAAHLARNVTVFTRPRVNVPLRSGQPRTKPPTDHGRVTVVGRSVGNATKPSTVFAGTIEFSKRLHPPFPDDTTVLGDRFFFFTFIFRALSELCAHRVK